ncbi:dihydrofolate reductase-like domain-containing protein [Radiomyces spectabilis]|uniref:dihydrofolate reductase-like domain-containing protein n=1 Tax=Radiomyces spectabilis TaxID=64574 RepID=UPI00221F06C1|nr:dihydrofolate reductase-like domain-containing protein [Radiomyces spectabilis]KAI8374470.1 dihydrofolate reductase-like domain-containing protein [Radiomyces spectabilis]
MTVNTRVVVVAAALAGTGGIGYRQDLPWNIPADWQWMERLTTKRYKHDDTAAGAPESSLDWHNIVIMGRNSWESIPMQGIPLQRRFNIVVSRNTAYDVYAKGNFSNVSLASSIHEAIAQATKLQQTTQGRIFLLGGAQIYEQGVQLPECTHVLLTRIYSKEHIMCDAFMPAIDPDHFRVATHDEFQEFVQETVQQGLLSFEKFQYEFCLYIRKQ